MKPGPTITISLRTTTADGAVYGRELTTPSDDEVVVAGVRRMISELRTTNDPKPLQTVPKVPLTTTGEKG